MTRCLLCQESMPAHFSLKDFLAFRPITEAKLCTACWQSFAWISGQTCQQCGRSHEDSDTAYCRDCLRWQDQGWYFKNCALLHYDAAFKAWVHQFKRLGDVRLAASFEQVLRDFHQGQPEAIWLSLPSSEANYRKRGFHQTECILEAVGLPYDQAFLPSQPKEGKQALKGRRERLQADRGIRLAPTFSYPKDQAFILFDDVYTTGATMFACYQALDQAGYQNLSGFTLAR
ncbi:ComF family protein [Aerococcus sanguinicola]|uniref:ComF family protein n=1 Tax=Aerococcus sanguinicola TaxID=119206 RepID=UPI0018A78E81|nr:double zinc ribbon domain-containing protein [Aerococcus sanguinicola]